MANRTPTTGGSVLRHFCNTAGAGSNGGMGIYEGGLEESCIDRGLSYTGNIRQSSATPTRKPSVIQDWYYTAVLTSGDSLRRIAT